MYHAYTEDQLVEPPELKQFFDDIAERLELADTTHATAGQLIDLPELQQFFADISYRLDLAETKQRRIDRKQATGFNVFKLIKPDENKLSAILADLLDPQGSHGQGDLFLRRLFEKLGLRSVAKLATNATIKREAPTHKILKYRRRIDVLVEAGTGALLAIENKVDSPEQTDQVKDYLEHLRQCALDQPLQTALIYLTPNGRLPKSLPPETVKELQDRGTLHCWSYQRKLRDWLETCRQDCAAQRIRNFLSDFIAHIESDMKRAAERAKETQAHEN